MSEKTIEEGKRAPAFKLESSDGKTVSLADFAGKNVVLYFYPKDATPGCTLEAQGFRDAQAAFKKKNAVVIGVSKDTPASHDKFKTKHKLAVQLGSDEKGAMLERYGVWVEKSMYGRKYMGIERATFLIDGEGVIREIWHKVKVPGHVDAVLKAIDAL